jgi:oligoendopeptidase F
MPSTAAAIAPELPAWDLSDLYDGQESPALRRDLDEADRAARAFSEAHAGRLDRLDGEGLAAAIAEYERIDALLGRAGSYGGLLFAGDSEDAAIGRFSQSINERATQISTGLVFFTLELNLLDEAHLAGLLDASTLARWQPFLRDLRVFRPHQLSQEVERVLHEKSVTGAAAWSRLFDETMAGLRVEVGEESLTVGDALNRLSDRDRSIREQAAKAIGAVFGRNIKLFSLITNTLAKDKEISDGLRGYARPGSRRNRGNMVEDAVIDALVAAVTADYGRLSHR